MCPKRVEFKYKEGCARCDEQTRDMLTKFLETGKLEGEFAPRGTFSKNICYLNKTRQKVTENVVIDLLLMRRAILLISFITIK